MKNIILFDTIPNRIALKPFSDTRPIATIRLGINTIKEKWESYITGVYSYLTEAYLESKFGYISINNNLCINGSICPDQHLVNAILTLEDNQVLIQDNTVIAFWCKQIFPFQHYQHDLEELYKQAIPISYTGKIIQLQNKWDIFLYNAQAIIQDFKYIQNNNTTNQVQDTHTITYNPENIFIHQGVEIRAAILNAEQGPIYIGKDAIIEEGSIIKGPVAICEGAQVKMGSRIYGGTTIGPYSKAGGEITNSVIFEYSNKAHEGFLGHSVIGEWCNLGAHTTVSNLRNDYKQVRVWDYAKSDFIKTNIQFCGLFMGAYSKCAINSIFNTATVVGISTNLYGIGFFKSFVCSFAKGNTIDNVVNYSLDSAFININNTLLRRNKELTEIDKNILTYLYNLAKASKYNVKI